MHSSLAIIVEASMHVLVTIGEFKDVLLAEGVIDPHQSTRFLYRFID